MCDCRVIVSTRGKKVMVDPNETREETRSCTICPGDAKPGKQPCPNPNPCAKCRGEA
jgi:hypothetical protein